MQLVSSVLRKKMVSMSGQKIGLSVAVVAFLGLALFHALFGYYFGGQSGFSVGNDDSFISYRYAKNLIDAGLPTFNIEEPRLVEGYSNPLHVVLSAIVYRFLGTDLLYPAMAALGALAVAAAIAMIGIEVARTLNRRAGIAIALVLAALPPLWIHGTSGLETAFVFFLQVIVWLSAVRLARGDGGGLAALVLASALLITLRVDGFLFPMIAGAWLLWSGQRIQAAAVVATCAVVVGALTAFRLWYYGLPLPLPAYVKASGPLLDRFMVAARYLAGVSYKNGFVFPALGAGLAAFAYFRGVLKEGRGIIANPPSFELFAFAAVIAYYFMVGGDIYRERFIIITYPLGLVLLFRVLVPLGSAWVTASATAAILFGVLTSVALDPRLDYRFEYPKYDRWLELGRFLADRHEGAYLATGAAGKIPYYSGLRTLDMLGLNTPEIAFTEARGANPGHNKFDPDFVFSQRPDIICSHVWGDGQLTYGVDRDRYTEAGYRLAYLVSPRWVPQPGIRILDGEDDAELTALIASGYDYGCVLR